MHAASPLSIKTAKEYLYYNFSIQYTPKNCTVQRAWSSKTTYVRSYAIKTAQHILFFQSWKFK